MAVKALKNTRSPNNLATGKKEDIEDSFKSAGLFAIDSSGTIVSNNYGIFLLNPSRWQESKSANWIEHTNPGQSDPTLQWISSGARTVTFEALVTNDTAYFVSGLETQKTKNKDFKSKIKAEFADLASKFFKVAPPKDRTVNAGIKPSELDISSYLNYYRSLLYPLYDNKNKPGRLKESPPVLVLMAGTAINQLVMGLPGTKVSSQHDLWVLVDLQINITKQLPSLAPLEATVTFKLMQYTIRSFDRRRFTENN